MLTVIEVAGKLRVSEHTVLRWLSTGELRGVNVARRTGCRPSWRIPESALQAFEAARAATPALPKVRRSRRSAGGVIEFYPAGAGS